MAGSVCRRVLARWVLHSTKAALIDLEDPLHLLEWPTPGPQELPLHNKLIYKCQSFASSLSALLEQETAGAGFQHTLSEQIVAGPIRHWQSRRGYQLKVFLVSWEKPIVYIWQHHY